MTYELQSQTISEITKALVEAQRVITNAVKDRKNPFYKSDYATLESILDTIREPMASNGLAYVQQLLPDDVLVTTLSHTSGEWFRSYLPLHLVKSDPQGMGSAITYGRRYSIAAMVGITQADDDGNEHVDDLEKLNIDQFTAKVKQELADTMTKDVIVNILKDAGFAWKTASKRVMYNYIASKI